MVAGARKRASCSLLRRHIGRGPDNIEPARLLECKLIDGKTKIQHLCFASGVDDDIGRLDVAVQLAGGVQNGDALDDLAHDVTHQ